MLYFYSQHNEAVGVIATLFNLQRKDPKPLCRPFVGPTLSNLALLGFIYFTFSHFVFKEIKFDLIGNRIDGCLPINPNN